MAKKKKYGDSRLEGQQRFVVFTNSKPHKWSYSCVAQMLGVSALSKSKSNCKSVDFLCFQEDVCVPSRHVQSRSRELARRYRTMALRRSAHWRFCYGCMMFVLSLYPCQTLAQKRAQQTAPRRRRSQTLEMPLWSARLPHPQEKWQGTLDTSLLLPNHGTRGLDPNRSLQDLILSSYWIHL